MRTFLTALALATAAIAAPAATLRWAAQNDVLTLDPYAVDHGTTAGVLQNTYEALTDLNLKMDLEPQLAVQWTFISPTQVRFELRKGVKFHDGTPFTADDVVFSFERSRQPQARKLAPIAGIREVRKISSHTVDFLLDGPNPLLLRSLAGFYIMSKTWCEKNKATQVQDLVAKTENFASRHAMGTGPYRITEWLPDQRISMVVNKDWWGRNTGNVTELVYLPIKSPATRVAALLSGDVDLITDSPTQNLPQLKEDARLKVLEGMESRVIFFGMNQGNKELLGSDVKGRNPLRERRVREALNLAIDREALKRVTMRGLSIPAGLMVPPDVSPSAPDIDVPVKADPARAKKLLAEAGYPNGLELPLLCPNDRYINDEAICLTAISLWAKIGVKVKLTTQPFSIFTVTMRQEPGPPALALYGWGSDSTLDANYFLRALAHTRSAGGNGNYNFWSVSDARLDELIDASRTEIDVAKRDTMLREALMRVRDEFLFIPLHYQLRPWTMKKGVQTPYRWDSMPLIQHTSIQ
ncbi:MAG: ABC transporter substrate-binding protein [Paucibacter sp.]|nr:ABC transporter substrate-binding protein [Roseateles sp.]